MVASRFAGLIACAIADPILLAPPSSSSDTTSLLVWVPGGGVPNAFYKPLMQEIQNQLEGKIDLWVSIAECPGNLCVPVVSSIMVSNALQRGLNASGVANTSTWMGGHSLGAVEADAYCRHNAGADVAGGCVLMGGYVGTNTGGASIDNMLKYPVPLLQLGAELDFGSARATKMAPYYTTAERAGKAQLDRTPVVVVPDIDHSDMCEGFPVEGDLPSATTPAAAIKALAEPTVSFMLQQILDEKEAAKSMADHLQFTKGLLDPITNVLATEKEQWCQELQKDVAGPLASKISVISSRIPTPGELHGLAPQAKLNHDDGTVEVTVVTLPTYEGNWPVADGAELTATAAPPAVKRNTATSLGCRVVSRAKLAKLLKEEDVEEPQNACHARNQAALDLALSSIAQRSLDRYNSDAPCNSCAKGVGVKLLDDTVVDDIKSLEDAGLNYDLSDTGLTVSSSSWMSDDEYSCALLSPARCVDFLMFDAFSASRFEAPSYQLV